jgi:hypothetical protein
MTINQLASLFLVLTRPSQWVSLSLVRGHRHRHQVPENDILDHFKEEAYENLCRASDLASFTSSHVVKTSEETGSKA